jgi:sigma-B regulation protein RsbU (phosphoserine phosphatase)
MPSQRRSPDLSDWRAIASLGEQLVSANSLIAQHDRIVAMTRRMVRGRVDVWLHENLFRLPDWKQPRTFPSQPRSEAMRKALALRKVYVRRGSKKRGEKTCVVAMPVEDQNLVLGVLQISRPAGPNFTKEELELLESIAGVVAVGLYASHRVEVGRFRLGELNLVRQVSAEIATVLELDELSRRVCELIQKTFNYYYVAIFTMNPGDSRLRFRSSARAAKKSAQSSPLALEVEVGEGLIGEAAASGTLVAAADVRADERYRHMEPLPETRSEVVIPLKLKDRVLGVLDVQSDRVRAFHPNDLMLLQALADNVARAVEGARLYSDVRRRADQLALLADVGRSVTSTLEMGEMMKEAATLIQDRFGFQHVALFTVHPNRRLIEYEAGSGKRSQALGGYSIALDDERGIIPWVARAGQTVLANDVRQDARYRPSPWPPRNTRSELTVPLVFGERVLGLLDIQSDRVNAFTDEDRVMFEAAAGTIAASIRNADLYRSEQWRRQVADSLREVAGLLSENIGVDEALEAILTELERNLAVDVSAIWLVDQGDLYVAAVHGADARDIERGRTEAPEAAAELSRLMLSDEPVIRQPTDPIWPLGRAAHFPNDYSSLAAPLRVGNQPVGIIALAHHDRGRYGHEARAMAATFASYAAVAIENARLYDSAQEQAYASAALLQVAQAVASPADLDDILSSILRIMPILLGVARAALYGWDGARRCYMPRAEFGLTDTAKQALWSREIGEGHFKLMDAARKAGETTVHMLRLQDAPENWPRMGATQHAERALSGAARLLISVPLLMKSDLLGVLLVEEGDEPHRFRGRRLEIVQGIAQQIAMALQNERLETEMVVRERLETEVQLARQIQQSFIPDVLPQREGWELAAHWEPARQVGGDHYDVIDLPDGRLGLFIADVADKGMPAALFMALTRTLFRAAAAQAVSPGETLRRMNDLLVPDAHQGMFVTAVYAVLDARTGEFTYANAGHNPPLWIDARGKVERLTRTTIALGVIESGAASDRTIRIQPGESVLLYTDGLTEAFSSDGNQYTEGRLLETVAAGVPGSADALLEDLQSSLHEFMGAEPLYDDLTMLVVRRK